MLATLRNLWSKPSPGPLTPSANAENREVVHSKRTQGSPLPQGTLASLLTPHETALVNSACTPFPHPACKAHSFPVKVPQAPSSRKPSLISFPRLVSPQPCSLGVSSS